MVPRAVVSLEKENKHKSRLGMVKMHRQKIMTSECQTTESTLRNTMRLVSLHINNHENTKETESSAENKDPKFDQK